MAYIESRCPRARLGLCSWKKTTTLKPVRGEVFGKPASQWAGFGSESGDFRDPLEVFDYFEVIVRFELPPSNRSQSYSTLCGLRGQVSPTRWKC